MVDKHAVPSKAECTVGWSKPENSATIMTHTAACGLFPPFHPHQQPEAFMGTCPGCFRAEQRG